MPYNMPSDRDINTILREAFDDIPGDSYQQKLNHLANCYCCERHQVNKPTVFSPWHETPFNNTRETYSCMCNCRHLARFICRQTDSYNPRGSPRSVLHI